MIVPDNWETLNETQNSSGARRLQSKPPMEITMEPGPDTDPKILGLTWRIIDFETDEMNVQILFDHPRLVSSEIDNDQITLTFWDSSVFQTADGRSIAAGL